MNSLSPFLALVFGLTLMGAGITELFTVLISKDLNIPIFKAIIGVLLFITGSSLLMYVFGVN